MSSNTPNSPTLNSSSASALHLLAATAPTSSVTAVVSYKWRSLIKIVQLRADTLLLFNRAPRDDLLNATHAIPLTARNIAYHPSSTTVAITGIPFHFHFGSVAAALRFQRSITLSSSISTSPTSSSPSCSSSSISSGDSASKRRRHVSVKKVAKHDAFFSPSDLRAVVDERIALQLATASNSPFLPRLHRAFQTPAAFHLVTDAPELGDVGRLLARLPKRRVSERVARVLFAEAVLALSDVQALGLLLRDVTPAKLGLTETGHVQLHDLTHAKQLTTTATEHNDPDVDDVHPPLSDTSSVESDSDDGAENDKESDEGMKFARTASFTGTRSYMAPEQLSPSAHTAGYGTPADVWALGITLYTMVTGRHPFMSASTTSLTSLQERVTNGPLRFPKSASAEFRALIEGMLEKDAEKRFSVEDIKQNAWLKDVSWAQVRRQAEQDEPVEEVLTLIREFRLDERAAFCYSSNANTMEETEESDEGSMCSELKRSSFESCSSSSSTTLSSPPSSPSPTRRSFSSRRRRRSRSSFNSLSLPTKQDIHRKLGEVCPWTKYKLSAHTSFSHRRISSLNNVELLGFDYSIDSIKSH